MQHTRWASKDLTLAIGVNIAMGLAHLMMIGQRGLGIYPHQGALSLMRRAMRLFLGLVGQLAGCASLNESLIGCPHRQYPTAICCLCMRIHLLHSVH